MTDKELKKLSRLELLELLLEASKENKKLKEEIQKLKAENKTAQNIENLSAATVQIESALKYANSLTDTLKENARADSSVGNTVNTNAQNMKESRGIKSDSVSDRDLYWRTMGFYAKHREALDVLPDDLRNSIEHRINEILKRIKKN